MTARGSPVGVTCEHHYREGKLGRTETTDQVKQFARINAEKRIQFEAVCKLSEGPRDRSPTGVLQTSRPLSRRRIVLIARTKRVCLIYGRFDSPGK